MVVWLAIIIVVIILLIIAALILGLIYIPLLPLFLQVWVLEIFTNVSMAGVLPMVNIVLFFIFVLRTHLKTNNSINVKEAVVLMIGLVSLFLGAGIFGAVWENLQLAQQYHVENTVALIGSPCRSTVTYCLIGDEISPHSGQLVPAIIAGAIWYFGIWAIRRVIISE